MASNPEVIIARISAMGSAADPDYRQVLRCGRHEMLADERPARGEAKTASKSSGGSGCQLR